MDLINEYRWRGMLQDATEGAAEALASGPVAGYIGFDPSASSLHVGNLSTVMGLVHFQRAGNRAVTLCGGGTGLIGDPSGKTEERQLLTKERVAENAEGVRAQLAHFLDFDSPTNPAVMVNNLDWLGELNMVDFLRDVGKHFSVNALVRKEAVRRRLEADEEGITFTEFSYSLLQAYDFLELHGRHGCTFQMGGSDQWGNITAGIDLIRKSAGAKAYGVTFPLLVGAGGVKFGKTEAGAVWLDPERTSPYRFYQFWVNADDRDVIGYVKRFTLFDKGRVAELENALESEPHLRGAQKALAEDVTRRVHGETGLASAAQATRVLFGGEIEGLGAKEISDIFADVPASQTARATFEGEGVLLAELLADCGVTASRGEARRSIEQGGIYVNNVRVADVAHRVGSDALVEGRFLVLRKGKKNYHLVELS